MMCYMILLILINVKKMDSVLLLFCKKMEVNKFVEIGFIVISNRK